MGRRREWAYILGRDRWEEKTGASVLQYGYSYSRIQDRIRLRENGLVWGTGVFDNDSVTPASLSSAQPQARSQARPSLLPPAPVAFQMRSAG